MDGWVQKNLEVCCVGTVLRLEVVLLVVLTRDVSVLFNLKLLSHHDLLCQCRLG